MLPIPPTETFIRPIAPPLDQLMSRSSIDFSSSRRPELGRSPASLPPFQSSPFPFLRQDSENTTPSRSGAQTPAPCTPPCHKPSIVPRPPPSTSEGPQTIQVVNKRSPFGAILSRTLPSYTGAHAVGVCDIEVPIRKQKFGYFEHKSMPSRGVGLTVDTVFFTMFYPAVENETNCRVVWFPRYVKPLLSSLLWFLGSTVCTRFTFSSC